MKHVRPHTVGLVFGSFLVIWHVVWSVLVAAGAPQAVIDFILRSHMITPPNGIAEFHLSTAAGLVLVNAGIGYIVGWTVGSSGIAPSRASLALS
jgi:hypothetical protein